MHAARHLTRFSVAAALLVCAAWPLAAAAPVRVHPESRDEQAYRHQLNDMGECVYRMMPERSLASILSDDWSESQALGNHALTPACVPTLAIQMKTRDFRNALARGAYLNAVDPAKLPPGSTAQHEYAYLNDTPLNDAFEYYQFSNCVFLADPDGSRKLLRGVPGSSTESSALKELQGAMNSCASHLAAPVVQLLRFTSSLSRMAFLHSIGQPFDICEAEH